MAWHTPSHFQVIIVVLLALSFPCIASGFAWSSKLDSLQQPLSDVQQGDAETGFQGDVEENEDDVGQSLDINSGKKTHESNRLSKKLPVSNSIAMDVDLSQSGPALDDLY
jgi:hypothetical protein